MVVPRTCAARDRPPPQPRDRERPRPAPLGGEPARQHDPTTCGSTGPAQLAAAGDLVLALWLETGSRIGPVQSPELAAAARAGQPGDTRFVALQRAPGTRPAQGAILGMPWPDRFGTPPWGVQPERPGTQTSPTATPSSTPRPPARLARAIAAVDAALRRGVPVPLFTGGTPPHRPRHRRPAPRRPRHPCDGVGLARLRTSRGEVLGSCAATSSLPLAGGPRSAGGPSRHGCSCHADLA